MIFSQDDVAVVSKDYDGYRVKPGDKVVIIHPDYDDDYLVYKHLGDSRDTFYIRQEDLEPVRSSFSGLGTELDSMRAEITELRNELRALKKRLGNF